MQALSMSPKPLGFEVLHPLILSSCLRVFVEPIAAESPNEFSQNRCRSVEVDVYVAHRLYHSLAGSGARSMHDIYLSN